MPLKWYNYFLSGKQSRLTDGHLPADKLLKRVLDHDGGTAYCCYFDLDYSELRLECWEGKYDRDGKKIYKYIKQGEAVPESSYKPKLTFTSYDQAPARPALGLISFDFDAEDPQDALKDVRNFVEWLGVDDLAVFFSGSKGFHVMVPEGYFGLKHDKDLPYVLRDLAKFLKTTYPTLDPAIYNYNRKFRVPFTKHEKTGLFKVMVDLETLKSEHALADARDVARDSSSPAPSMKKDFEQFIVNLPLSTRAVLPQIQMALENCRRKTYEIDKSKSGTLDASTKFESFDDKKCIKKMLENTCAGNRNNAALRIVNDYFRVGRPRARCEKDLIEWAKHNQFPLTELTTIITNIYDKGMDYNFGCQDEIKASFCTSKCVIRGKLDPDKRPPVVDSTQTEFKQEQSEKKPTEKSIVDKILKANKCSIEEKTGNFLPDGKLIKQGRDLFKYEGGKWNHLDEGRIDKLKAQIGKMYQGHDTYKHIDQCFKHLMIICPSVPQGRNMFAPNPTAANFKNGTLHLIGGQDKKYSLLFTKHAQQDFLTYQIPFDYEESLESVNTEFEDMLKRVFKDDPDAQDKINAIAEMYGASLMPFFPHLFYLYGVSGSGKSTIILILRYLLGEEDNISSVEPKDFHGFNMESMAGKLVNMVTDVSTRFAISENIVKQIEDRVPVRIRRKNLKDLIAPLPAVHIFAGNGLMKSMESDNHSFERRWTIIKFDTVHTGPKRRNYAEWCFKQNPQGVINFAVKGLKRLIENQGYFAEFQASKEQLREWGESNDLISQFLKDEGKIDESSKPIGVGEGLKIERLTLWNMFKEWQDHAGHRYDAMKKFEFYQQLRQRGIFEKRDNSGRYFAGIGELPPTSITDAGCVDGSKKGG
ncbi:MAG: hypothetical protein HC842_07415 [Cytophagales bacterium]|nr:hypothetical protein [Cytophagales bacterium]